MLFAIIVITSYGVNVSKYIINEKKIIIVAPFYSKVISINEIKRIEIIPNTKLSGMIRVFGIGGLFGYYGKFRSIDLGQLFFYASKNSNYVLIELKTGNKLVITPDDLDMINHIK